jgi:hypothetical protein
MSTQAWALEQMFKYRLQVDFSRRTIDCRGYTCGWGWNFADNSDFYQALTDAIKDITK